MAWLFSYSAPDSTDDNLGPDSTASGPDFASGGPQGAGDNLERSDRHELVFGIFDMHRRTSAVFDLKNDPQTLIFEFQPECRPEPVQASVAAARPVWLPHNPYVVSTQRPRGAGGPGGTGSVRESLGINTHTPRSLP